MDPTPGQVRGYQWHWTGGLRAARAGRRLESRPAPGARPVDGRGPAGRRRRGGRRPPAPLGSRPRQGHDRVRGDGTAIRLPGSDGASCGRPSPTSPCRTTGGCAAAATNPPDCWPRHRCGSPSPPGRPLRRSARGPEPGARGDEPRVQRVRDTARARLLGQVRDAHAVGAVGVEVLASRDEDKLAVASAFIETRSGWHCGRLGIPYRITGRS